MVTKILNDETLPVAGDDHRGVVRPGLTAAPDALLAIFDRIERSVAAGCRAEVFPALPRRMRIVWDSQVR